MFEKKGEFLRSHRKQNIYLIMNFQQVRTTRKHFQWHSNHREGCGEVVFLQGCCDHIPSLINKSILSRLFWFFDRCEQLADTFSGTPTMGKAVVKWSFFRVAATKSHLFLKVSESGTGPPSSYSSLETRRSHRGPNLDCRGDAGVAQ